jgi:Peptidase M50B-like
MKVQSPKFYAFNLRRVLKWIKFFIAVLLLPVCAGAAMALGAILRISGGADITWIPFLAGVACWCVIFSLLPKPMWIYVFGHELTHALWAWLFGGRVKKMKVSSEGGHVIVTKTNFLITLAPYFFPLYAVILMVIFAVGHGIWGWESFLVYFDLLLGAAYAFHVTLTFHALQTSQSDITSQGYLFSGVVIFLGNVVILLFGIPLLTQKISLGGALNLWMSDIMIVLHWLQNWV